jgi:hypothetical protein
MSAPQIYSDPFFELGGDFQWNAYVGRQSDETAYADGYMEAALLMVNAVIDGRLMGSRDTLVMPILYNTRHGVELALKDAVRDLHRMGLLREGPAIDHDVALPWRLLNEGSFGDEALREIIATLEPYVLSLSRVDADGQSFRYARNTDEEISMADRSLVNLQRIRDSLVPLHEQLRFLQWRVAELFEERATRSFTTECSRRDLVAIARRLPPRPEWTSDAFDIAKAAVRERYGLSSNAFTRALNVIQTNREMGPIIGLEFDLAHLCDDKVLRVLELWGLVWPVRAPNRPGPILLSEGRSVEDIQEAARVQKEVDTALLSELGDDDLADLETVYQLGRSPFYPEQYDGQLELRKNEHRLRANRWEVVHYLTGKGNLASSFARGVDKLGRPSLATRIEAWRPDLF